MPTWNMNFIYSLDRYIEVITQAWNKPSPETILSFDVGRKYVRVYLLLRADISCEHRYIYMYYVWTWMWIEKYHSHILIK